MNKENRENKKKSKPFQSFMLGLAVIALIVGGIVFAVNLNYDKGFAAVLNQKYIKTADLDDTLPLDSVSKINIRSEYKVNIENHESEDIRMTLAGETFELFTYRKKEVFEKVGDTVNIEFYNYSFWSIPLKSMALTVYIPSTYAGNINVDVTSGGIYMNADNTFENLTLDMSSGEIKGNFKAKANVDVDLSSGKVNGAINAGGDVKIKISSGIINLTDIKAKALTCKLSSGSISVDTITATSIHSELSSGNFKAKNVTADDINVKTSSGAITLELLKACNITSRVSSGNIDIKMPSYPDVVFDCNISSGTIYDNYFKTDAVIKDDYSTSIGDTAKAIRINIKISSGKVHLTKI